MKTTVFASIAGLAVGLTGLFFVPEAKSGVILPNLYASEYCTFRSLGVNQDEAMSAAMDAAYISSGTSPQVTIDGVLYDADVVRAVRAANDRCPEL